jgi:hypothetical protein
MENERERQRERGQTNFNYLKKHISPKYYIKLVLKIAYRVDGLAQAVQCLFSKYKSQYY